jgi:hypothetical protein
VVGLVKFTLSRLFKRALRTHLDLKGKSKRELLTELKPFLPGSINTRRS